jgi:hypothetical protein
VYKFPSFPSVFPRANARDCDRLRCSRCRDTLACQCCRAARGLAELLSSLCPHQGANMEAEEEKVRKSSRAAVKR